MCASVLNEPDQLTCTVSKSFTTVKQYVPHLSALYIAEVLKIFFWFSKITEPGAVSYTQNIMVS